MTQQHSLFDLRELQQEKSTKANFTFKEHFLQNLKAKNLHYKRYTKSPLRYGGGKSLAVGLILEHFPNDTTRLVSPFMGGGSVEIASALELNLEVKAFDIFDILVNFWQVLIADS